MNAFEVIGGQPLQGTVVPQGAKNEALQIVCATLLTSETVTVEKVPDIKDVNLLIDILRDLGVEVNKTAPETYTFKAKNIDLEYLQSPEFRKKGSGLRGSIMLVGPLLARFGKAYMPRPGGDKIGRRKLDTHFLGFKELGASYVIDEKNEVYRLAANELAGKYILLDEPSVTGTANIIMTAVMAKGITTLYNAACEPYIQQLCTMLNKMGAIITGVGSNQLIIEGVPSLGGCTHKMLPDMIEIGSFIGLAAMTAGEITIKDVRYDMLCNIPRVFQKIGIEMELRGDDLFIPAQQEYQIKKNLDGSIPTIYDGPWPLFTPDLLSIVLTVCTQAKGSVLIHQKMFESRLFFTDKLIDMGAQIILCDPHRATVIGLNKSQPLRGIKMSSPDIRAGVSLLIAALSAEGKSVISNIHQIDRGYQHIDERLIQLGAQIKRIEA